MTELEKMKAVMDESQAIGEFIAWLRDVQNLSICQWHEDRREVIDEDEPHDKSWNIRFRPAHFTLIHTSIEGLLAKYFDIDLKKVEQEKMEVLNEFRSQQNENAPN